MKICNQCGNILSEKEMYCGVCGQAFTQDATVAQPNISDIEEHIFGSMEVSTDRIWDLDIFRTQIESTKFCELIEIYLMDRNNINTLEEKLMLYVLSLPIEAQPLVSSFIDRWNSFSLKKGFWSIDTSDILKLIKQDSKKLFDDHNIKYDIDHVFTMFEIIVLNFVCSMTDRPLTQEAIGINIAPKHDLFELRMQQGETKFYQLIKTQTKNKSKIELLDDIRGYLNMFRADMLPSIEAILYIWRSHFDSLNFWHKKISEIILHVEHDSKKILSEHNMQFSDDTIFYILQIIVLDFAYSAIDKPEMQRFMGIDI